MAEVSRDATDLVRAGTEGRWDDVRAALRTYSARELSVLGDVLAGIEHVSIEVARSPAVLTELADGAPS